MILRWFISKTVRHAMAMYRHVEKLLAAQRDILSPQAIEAVSESVAALRRAVEQGANKTTLIVQMKSLEDSANKWLKPYPNAAWRENVEVLLVAMAVAMGIRTFFLQPFKIPTGSMQPTLYGITHTNLIGQPDVEIPNAATRFFNYWINGVSYVHVVSKATGALGQFDATPKRLLLFNLKQSFEIGGRSYTVWFPPEDLLWRAGLVGKDQHGRFFASQKVFKQGEDIIRLEVLAGDHLFVNRLTYNFCHPRRGDIVVFKTRGIGRLADQDTYYIKRLVGLGGERLSLKPDYELIGFPRVGNVSIGHLVVDGRELSSATPHFENLYSFSNPPEGATTLNYSENQYYGHALLEALAPGYEYALPSAHYFVMGDNTMNSSDSRFWGDFSQNHVIGKSSFVYWPISSRFGFGYR